jgi:hypothetical protein
MHEGFLEQDAREWKWLVVCPADPRGATAAPGNSRRYRIKGSSRNVLAGGGAVVWLTGTGAGWAAPVGVVGSM